MTEVVNFHHFGSTQKLDVAFDHWLYIGRPSPKFGLPGSPLANPYRMKTKNDRNRVIEQYKQWLWANLGNEPVFRAMLQIRRHTRLVCWCSPKPCHGDIIVSAWNWLNSFAETDILMYQLHNGQAKVAKENTEKHSYWTPYLENAKDHELSHKTKANHFFHEALKKYKNMNA